MCYFENISVMIACTTEGATQTGLGGEQLNDSRVRGIDK